MIRHYITLRPEFRDKNIYVWDIGIRCLYVFSHLACRGVDVKGFVTNIEEYIGESICSRAIISPEDFKEDEKGIIIVHDAVSSGTFKLVCGYGDVYRYSDVMGINEDLEGAEFYLYGTGTNALKIIKDLANRDMILKGFLESSSNCARQIMNIPVMTPDNLSSDEHVRVILSAKSQIKSFEMLEELCRCGFKGNIYVQELLPLSDRWGMDPFLLLNMVACEHRKLLLCCEEELGSGWLHSVLDMYGYKVEREVCFEGSKQRGIEDIWSLADEDPNLCVLLIFALNPVRRADIIEAAQDLGFTEESRNYAGIQECCYNREHLAGPLLYESDNRVTFSLDYSPVGGIPGWAVYGNGEKASNKILVLGGSTSSEVYIAENWVSKLHRLCSEHGYSTAIYNGAHEGNRVMDELIRLTRGLQIIEPNIVISMSGLNDVRPASNKFEEHPGENFVEYWRRIESYMKVIAESAGCKFYTFLQPFNTFVRGSVEDALMFTHEGHHDRKKDMIDLFSSDDFYYSMIDLLQYRKNMFIDSVHYSDKGHEEIAKCVFEIIKGALK